MIFSSPPSSQINTGAELLVYSILGAITATVISVGRWVLIETGEVLSLLFAHDDSQTSDRACPSRSDRAANADDDGFGSDFSSPASPQCGNALAYDAGSALRAVGASPFARAVPLILLFLSFVTLTASIILIHDEFRRRWSRLRAWPGYAAELAQCSQRFATAMGVSGADKLDELTETDQKQVGTTVNSTNCTDGLVIDDLLRKYIGMAVDFSAVAWGGVVLYGLPDGVFGGSPDGARAARRRLIRAADPSLERALFLPGGVRDPPLQGGRATGDGGPPGGFGSGAGSGGAAAAGGGGAERPADGDIADDALEDCSSSTLLASPDRSVDSSESSRRVAPTHCGRVICAGEGEEITGQNDDGGCSKETLADALSDTVKDILISNFVGNQRRHGMGVSRKAENQQNEGLRRGPSSSPQACLEKILRRASIVAASLFLCHLRGSPSARRSWASAARFLTSLGLASAAVGAGVASSALGSNAARSTATASNPLVGMLCSQVLDQFSQMSKFPTMGIEDRMQCMINRLREEIRRNKGLQAGFAFVVLGGMRSFCGRRGAGRRKGIR